MRIIGFCLSCAVAALIVRGAETKPEIDMANLKSVTPGDPMIAYMGRVRLVGDEAVMGYPGITVRFVYRGPAPLLRLTAGSENCDFNLTCNGWDSVVIHLAPGKNEIALPLGAAPSGGWLVELVRRTEAWQGIASFRGLLLPPGCELLSPPAWPKRKMLFIGDSITCGEYVERFPPEYISTPRSTNAARSFGMLLGRWLKAQVHLVSCGGRGVIRDWTGKTDGINAPQFFQLTLPDDPEVRWNHASYVPDVVVVSLGQNDFNKDVPDEAMYTKAYDDFVGQIRAAYPRAGLVLAEVSLFDDAPGTPDRAKRDLLHRVVQTVAARRRAAGDKRIKDAPVGYYPGTPGNAHLVAFQHEQVAQELLGPIQSLTGW